MKGKVDQPSVDARLARLARRQYGLATRQQLRRLGLGETGIDERLRTGHLHRIHRGVYSVGHDALRAEAYRLAAVLACGEGAVLSHASAAEHWSIRPSAATKVDVTVPVRSGRARRKGIRVHRSGRLTADEVTTHRGIPVTTVARTLLDLADVLPEQALKRAIDQAEYLRLFDLTSLVAAVEGNPGRRGQRVLALAAKPSELTRSDLEQRFLARIERRGLPRPRVGVRIEGYEADFLWPDAKLVVETDGFAAHGTRKAFEHDRLRDRRLRRAGFHTIRLTPEALRYDEDAIVEELAAELSRSRVSSKPPRRSSSSPASARYSTPRSGA